MSGYTRGDARNCRNCQQPIHFGGVHWWHNHNESGYCFSVSTDLRQAEPELDAQERVRASAPELLHALKGLRSFMWAEGYADQTVEMAQADAAIAKVEGR
ncbi:MAG TPA: hypothetical protein VK638_35815 [Edaphobacter sp.]|nr:hypothetical protein [Edaphobacter sp.]